MKSLVLDALDEAARTLQFPGDGLMDSLGVDVRVQVDALAESVGFVEYKLDGLDFSQELAAGEYLLSAGSVTGQDLLDASVVELDICVCC